MAIRVTTLWRVRVTSLTTSVLAMRLSIDINIKISFKGSYNKQNLTLMVISYEIYKTRQRLASYISYEMTIRVGPLNIQVLSLKVYFANYIWQFLMFFVFSLFTQLQHLINLTARK